MGNSEKKNKSIIGSGLLFDQQNTSVIFNKALIRYTCKYLHWDDLVTHWVVNHNYT